MKEFNFPVQIHVAGLDAVARPALSGKWHGVSTYGDGRPISVWLEDSAVQADQDNVAAIISAHDPVFLSVDKTTIAADGVDAATITISAPKQGAAPVSILVNGTPYLMPLVNGVATDTITATAPTTITVTVQNPNNRTTDSLSILAR